MRTPGGWAGVLGAEEEPLELFVELPGLLHAGMGGGIGNHIQKMGFKVLPGFAAELSPEGLLLPVHHQEGAGEDGRGALSAAFRLEAGQKGKDLASGEAVHGILCQGLRPGRIAPKQMPLEKGQGEQAGSGAQGLEHPKLRGEAGAFPQGTGLHKGQRIHRLREAERVILGQGSAQGMTHEMDGTLGFL